MNGRIWSGWASSILPLEHSQGCFCLPLMSLLTQDLLLRGVFTSELCQIRLGDLNMLSPVQISVHFMDFLSKNLPFTLRTAYQFLASRMADPPLLVYIHIPSADIERIITNFHLCPLFYSMHLFAPVVQVIDAHSLS